MNPMCKLRFEGTDYDEDNRPVELRRHNTFANSINNAAKRMIRSLR